MRITWFGDKCFRIKFSAHDFVFFPDEAISNVSKNELVEMASIINAEAYQQFEPFVGAKPKAPGRRLIDVMDEAETYMTDGQDFVMDALPDERLVLRYLGNSTLGAADAWLNEAVVLCVGSAKQSLAALEALQGHGVRQVLLAISDMENLNMDTLAKTAGTLRLQMMEFGFAIEL